MRLVFVVQRYGVDVVGGAERACREFATRLAARGHEVDVLTSRAASYVDWADAYAAGVENVDGVRVHRLSVRAPRDPRFFGPLNARVPWAPRPVPYHLQREWLAEQGPQLPDLVPVLRDLAPSADLTVFFTYLYWPSHAGIGATAGVAPVVLHPLAHDEPPFYLSIYDDMFRLADAYAFLTEEEQQLVGRRFGFARPSVVTGLGIDLDGTVTSDATARFRARFDLGDAPYLLYVGRVDPSKGSDELVDFFVAFKERHDIRLKLVMLGELVAPVKQHRDVVVTGSVDEATKEAALAGCFALAQPSYFESFSIVLVEAWKHRRPALVQRHSEVLAGQARRSGGAIPYAGFAEFEAALEMLCESRELTDELGANGRAYVESRYTWTHVLDRYEELLDRTLRAWRPVAVR